MLLIREIMYCKPGKVRPLMKGYHELSITGVARFTTSKFDEYYRA